MESQRHPVRRFGRFLIKLLDSKKFPELVWLDKDQKNFKLSWLDNRKTSGKNDQNPIFEEWEIYNKRHNKGDPELWTKWKQTFRQALNTSPDVHYVQELSHEKRLSGPFKVYKFDDKLDLKNTIPFSLKNLPRSRIENKPPIQYSDSDSDNNIPKVVEDVLNMTNLSISDSSHSAIQRNNVQQSHVMLVSVIKENVMLNESSNTNFPTGDPLLHGCDGYKLDSDDWNEMLKAKQPIDPERVSLPSLNTPDVSMESLKLKTLVKFTVFYAHYPVLEETIGDDGVHLLAQGSWAQEMNLSTPECVNCPKNCTEKELPDPCLYINNNDPSMLKNAQLILEKFGKGLFLYCKNRKLFIRRLCTSRVYAWSKVSGTTYIDRRKQREQVLFDMNIFQDQLGFHKKDPANHPRPSSTVTLSFGEEYRDQSVGNIVMRLELTHVEAEELLQKTCPDPRNLQFSMPYSGAS